MGLDAGYHSAWIGHLLEQNGIQGVIGYRRHTHKTSSYGKYRFKYDPYFDAYICPEHKHLYWKTTSREGYRQYYSDSKECLGCPRRHECFGASAKRRMVERHVWQDTVERCVRRKWAGEYTIGEKRRSSYRLQRRRSTMGLRYARMLGIRIHAGAVVSDGCGAEHQAVGAALLVYVLQTQTLPVLF